MTQSISPLAGKTAPASILINIDQLLTAYRELRPDPSVASQRVRFGTSGHRGQALEHSFNSWHVLAITQAICDYRAGQGIDGPLFIGIDTHALSQPAFEDALEVLAANGVTTLIAPEGQFTPTPAVSLAIVMYNRGRDTHVADGIVVTPSHNPPDNGGFKYNPPHGGPAQTTVTAWIQQRANTYLERGLDGVKRISLEQAKAAATTHVHDFLDAYVGELDKVVNFKAIRHAGLHLGVDPMGGAGVGYWGVIAERHRLDLDIINQRVDPTFSFMPVDWDGKIRMDPSSSYAMQKLIAVRQKYDVAFACDTDHDRHGVVTRSAGLLQANHYLAVLVERLFSQRYQWSKSVAIGKTVVTTALIDRIAQRLDRQLFEVPVGFKWFAPGLLDGSLGFGGEESAGASLLRIDGSTWTTDKDGIVPALLSAELMAVTGKDPGELYQALVAEFGPVHSQRIEAPATAAQRAALGKLHVADIKLDTLAGEKIAAAIDSAPGNKEPIGGIRVSTAGGWFAARPSGTEDIYKIYAESFRTREHLQQLLDEAQTIVDRAIAGA